MPGEGMKALWAPPPQDLALWASSVWPSRVASFIKNWDRKYSLFLSSVSASSKLLDPRGVSWEPCVCSQWGIKTSGYSGLEAGIQGEGSHETEPLNLRTLTLSPGK